MKKITVAMKCMQKQLNEVLVAEAKIDALAEDLKEKRVALDEAMKKNRVSVVESGEFQGLRYKSTTYDVDDEKLLVSIQKDKDLLDLLLPRKASVGDIRKVIDGKVEKYKKYSGVVRRASTKHVDWKFTTKKIKRKAELTEAA